MNRTLAGVCCSAIAVSLTATAAQGQIVVGPGQVVPATISTADNFVLNGGTLAPTNVTLSGTIELPTSSSIIRPKNPLQFDPRGGSFETTKGPTNLNGPISGAGDLTLGNLSRDSLFVKGNNTYTGHTYLTAGHIVATTATAFGANAEGTTIQSGRLNLETLTQETFTVQTGGTLTLNAAAASYAHPVLLQGGTLSLPTAASLPTPVVVESAGGTVQISQGGNWSGGSTGTGDLRLLGSVTPVTPLNHQGKLTISGADLNIANGYTGETIITGDSYINHVNATGTSPLIRIQNSATLWLNQLPANDPDFAVESGTVRVENFDRPIAGAITLARYDAGLWGHATYNGPISLEAPEGGSHIRGGVVNGVISGSGDVDLAWINSTPSENFDVVLNGANTYTGTTRVYGSVQANTSTALGSAHRGTVVEQGVLEINAPTNEAIIVVPTGRVNINAAVSRLPQFAMQDQDRFGGEQTIALNVPGTYAQHGDVNDGRLIVNANTNISSLEIRNGGRIEIDAGTLTTSGEIALRAGRLQGQVDGATAIHKTTNGYGRLGDLPGFSGDIIIDQGVLRIGSSAGFGTSTGKTRVTGARDAVLMVHGESIVYDDIYLNNASGVNYTGGLLMTYEVYPQPLRMYVVGRVDLGNVGSWIGGHRDGTIQLDGPVTGGSLNKVGGLSLRINNSHTDYTGDTNVRQGVLILSGTGRLKSTSAVNLFDDDDSDRGMLYVDNEHGNSPDRIADNIPIVFHGGWLHQASGTEKYGKFDFQRGESLIDGTGKMTVGAISRERGAVATVQTSQTIAIDAAPPMTGGIIPWMTSRTVGEGINFNPFATVVNGQIRALTSYVGIGGATSASNVVVSSPTTLAADRDVNSLALPANGSLDLGGNDLTIHSGGLNLGYGGSVKNGAITPGTGNELIVHGVGTISAAITDNATGPVDVTYAPGAASYSSLIEGNNTYTGKTFVNTGEIYVKTPAALPEGGDVIVNGGTVILGYASNLSKHLGHVRVGGYGSLVSSSESTLSFDELVLEQGTLQPGKLVGDAPIYKRTTGAASIAASGVGATYSGQIVVEEGRLEANYLPSAKYRVEGGTLVLPTGANQVTLSGGEFEYFYFKGNIAVEEASRITPQNPENTSNYGLTGSFTGDGALLFESKLPLGEDNGSSAIRVDIQGHSPAYHGDVDIDTAIVSIRYNDSLGTGRIKVLPAGVLDFSPLQLNFDDSKLELANDVHLAGGELTGMDTVFARGKLLGDLYVTERSFIGTIDTMGAVHLAHGSRLTTTDYYDTNFFGDVLVSGTAELMVGRERVRSSGLGVNRGTVRLAGRIVSDAPVSLLRIDNAGLDDLELTSSFHVQTGQTLGVTIGGDYVPLEITAGSLTGAGTLLNPILLGAGGTLAPGQSPGTLSFANDFTLGSGAVYQWEIENPAAGPGVGWDLLDVEGALNFTATASSPWILQIHPLDAELPLGASEWLIGTAMTTDGFDPTAVQIALAGGSSALPHYSLAGLFSVEMRGTDLYLVKAVPEPAGLACISVLGLLLFAGTREL